MRERGFGGGYLIGDFMAKIFSSKSQVFFITIMFFIAGVAVGNFFVLDVFWLFCWLLFLMFLSVLFWPNKKWLAIFLFLAFFILGFYRFQISLPDFKSAENIYFYNNQQLDFSGIIIGADRGIKNQRVIIKEIVLDSKKVNGQILITAPLYPIYALGDKVDVDCFLKQPENFPGFNYQEYLAASGIYATCYATDINIVGDSYFSIIGDIKSKISQAIDLSVVEPQASVLQALILNNRRGIPDDVYQDFIKVGISHIIAISGSHIVIITMIIMYASIALGLRRQKSFWVALFFVGLYIVLIGAPASAVRGAVMALLVLFAKKIGRLGNSINSLLLAIFAMLLFNPKLLLSDVSFQLSFMAVLGLIYLSPILEKKFKQLPDFWELKNILIMTLSAQLFVTPLTLFYFDKFSVVSLLANLLILPMVPFLMIWAMTSSVVGIFSVFLGQLMGYVGWFLVNYMMTVSHWLGSWSFASLAIGGGNFLLAVGLYLLIFIFVTKNFFIKHV